MTGASLFAARLIWKGRWMLLALCIVLTVAALRPLAGLTVSNSLEIWYPDDDPVLEDYRRFLERYGSDELVVVAVSDPGGFRTDAALERISSLTDDLYAVDGVADVVSVTTVPDTMLGLEDRLLSDDARTTALLLRMEGGPGLEAGRHAILLRIGEVVADAGLPARLAGFGVIYDTLNQASTEGSAELVVVAHVAMFALLWLFFRRLWPTLVTLLAVSMAGVWTLGAYAAAGAELNMVTMVLPTLVLVIGIADSVHLLRSVARQDRALSRADRVVRGVAHALGPCLLTSLTTAAGFLALAGSELPVVRGLGVFGGIGVLAAFVTSIGLVPVALSVGMPEPHVGRSFLDALPARAHTLAIRHAPLVIGVFAAVALASIAGLARLDVDTYSIGYLADDHPVRRDSDLIEATVGAYASIDFVVRADDVLAPEVLGAISAWQRSAAALPAIDWSWSVVDATAYDASAAVPGNAAAEVSRLRILAPEVVGSLLSGVAETRVSFGAPMMSARDVQSLVDELTARAVFPEGASIEPAGYAAAYTRIVDRLVTAQRDGFCASFLLVFGALALAFRSLPRMLLALPANLLPVAATLGLMGWTGIPLDIATVTIASVLLGLVVDDTVHLLWPRDQRALRAGIGESARRAGGSLVLTTAVLCGGFLLLGLADIRSVAWFGRLGAFAALSALATDLLLLPSLATLTGLQAGRQDGWRRKSSPGETA